MKRTFVILLVACVLIAGLIGYYSSTSGKPSGSISAVGGADEPTALTAGEEENAAVSAPDYDALYALHAPDEVVATVNGRDVTWGEYFYLYFAQAKQVENYFSSMAMYYGAAPAWTDAVEEDGMSFAEMVKENAESSLRQICSIETLAEENGVTLSEEQEEEILAQEQEDIASALGDEATREDFDAYLGEIYLPRSLYDRMNRINYLYQGGFTKLFGENGENTDEEEALRFLSENEYLSATHILFMTIDPTTRESLDEETVAAKKAQAEQVAAELQAIEDEQERLARFGELKAELCEDTGKTMYPNGYIFLPGSMVAEFEDAVLGLEDYQVSDPVESTYGFHVIMRLPLDPDGVIEYSSAGTALTARSKAANEAYGAALQSLFDDTELQYAEGFEAPDLAAYLK